ncbi:hypothetical protein SCP_0607330 [Sparassis crispa]|uniref:F-box domain-containing protein n=1 Tax=Sparassis crispa TaxID=139825 RepID=A0A401GRB6_9APHY|nr:hypothetical protein SCP_0607330 [Sparassis crispa]GBE84753.1 hypothetical protein SCP_0607330 [Sparassis crispa]
MSSLRSIISPQSQRASRERALPPLPAGARLLELDDLMRPIIRMIWVSGGMREVVRIAPTCKALSETSLDLIWEHMTTLVPLFQLLPSNMWELLDKQSGLHYSRTPRKIMGAGGEYMQNPINSLRLDKKKGVPLWWQLEFRWTSPFASDVKLSGGKASARALHRFSFYAQRIKHLSWYNTWDVDSSVLQDVFQAWGPPTKSFPNLQTLQWNEAESDSVSQFLGPQSRFRNLKLINVTPQESDGVAPVIAKLLQSTGCLYHLSCRLSVLSADAIRSLACGEVLTEAHFCAHAADLQVMRKDPVENLFPKLRYLHLDVDQLEEGTLALFQEIHSTYLTEVVLNTERCPTADAVRTHLEELAKAPVQSALVMLELTFTCNPAIKQWEATSPSPLKITARELKPLLGMRSLTHFKIRAEHLALHDALFLESLAQALPAIETLHLMHNTSNSLVSLYDLRFFAKHCPSLRDLGFDIDARREVTPTLPVFLWSGTARTLCVGKGNINDPEFVVRYLLELFPSLEVVSHAGNLPKHEVALWGEASERLAVSRT